MTTSPSKQCRKCGESFPATVEYFTRKKGAPHGVRNECKGCEGAARRARYRDRREHRERMKQMGSRNVRRWAQLWGDRGVVENPRV